MADYSAYGPWVGGDDWRAWVGVYVTTNNETTFAGRVESWVWSEYGTTSGYSNICGAAAWDGNSWSYGSNTSISTNSWKKLKEVTFSVSKPKNNTTYETAWAKAEGVSGTYSGSSSQATVSVHIPQKKSYVVTYDNNGHGTAPSSQTKWHGETLQLRGAISATGYTFKGWNTKANGSGTSYAAGANYTGNADLRPLYAQWQAITYAVTYNANGGSGAPATGYKTYGATYTISSTRPTRTGYTFLGWATSAGATTATYQPGASYTTNAALSLYAVWKLAYTQPVITDATVWRCDSGGTAADDGTYALVGFSWSVDPTDSGEVDAVTVRWRQRGTSSWSGSATIAASGTSGSVSEVVGGSFSASASYDVQVVLTDTHGSTVTATMVLSPATFTLDFLAGGTGVAVGKAATRAGLDVAMETYHDGNVILANNKALRSFDQNGVNRALLVLNDTGNLHIGWGVWDANLGSTFLQGGSVAIRSKTGVTIEGFSADSTAWVYLVGSASGNRVRYCKRSGIVFVDVWYESSAGLSTTAKTLGTLPAGFRPDIQVETAAFGNVNNLVMLRVNPGGSIVAKVMSGTTNYVKGIISFPV